VLRPEALMVSCTTREELARVDRKPQHMQFSISSRGVGAARQRFGRHRGRNSSVCSICGTRPRRALRGAMAKLRRTEMKRRLRLAGTLRGIARLVVGAAVASGCEAPPTPQTTSPSPNVETIGKLDAQPRTREETGIEAWTIVRDGRNFWLDGKTATGAIVHQVRLRPYSETAVHNGQAQITHGLEVMTPRGGLARITEEAGKVQTFEFSPDDATFTAFSRDARAVPHSDEPLSCSVLQQVACAGTLIVAIGSCTGLAGAGPAAVAVCVGSILQIAGCTDCISGTDGNGVPIIEDPRCSCAAGQDKCSRIRDPHKECVCEESVKDCAGQRCGNPNRCG
jgi:hypothetical protein